MFSTVMRCLMMGVNSKKCMLRRFHSVNILECAYRNLDGRAYYVPRYIYMA